MSAVRKGFDNFRATENIIVNHYNIEGFRKDYSQDYLQKDWYFAKFRILQLLLESWFSVLGRGNFTAAFIN